MVKQTGTLAINNGIKTLFTKCTAHYCRQTTVKCFVHAHKKKEVVRLGKRIFSEERNFCARSSIVQMVRVFSQDM
jgi:hypothetical protein